MKFIPLLVFFSLLVSEVSAQTQQLSTKSKKAIEFYTEADNYRVRRQFPQAINLLNQALEKDKNFIEAWYRLGLVYHNMRAFPKAVENYEKALSLTNDVRIQKVIWFDLGETYLSMGEYEKAKQYFTDFIANETANKGKVARAKQQLASADFAIENQKSASKYRQRALSDTVNRFVLQYFPVLTADQQQLIFTRRAGHSDAHDEDLVICTKDETGRWSEPSSVSRNINSTANEGTCTISADGRTLIFTSCAGGPNRANYGSCDLYVTRKLGDEWSEPKNLGPNVNSPAWESQPSLSADGRTLYFVSDRRNGLGQRDIWVSTLDEKGNWTKAVNPGRPINSEFIEMSPFIHVNNQTLFFATNALQGFGGFDIFFSGRTAAGWSDPKNIGSPINNHDDQFSLFITADGKKGYYSHEETRENGFSFSRIFEVEIPEEYRIEHRSNYVKGVVRDKETKKVLSAQIELINLNGNTRESLVESDSLNGRYLIVLTEGAEYALYVTKPGYVFRSLNFNYSEGKNFEPIVVDVELERVKEGSVVVLNNIFFDHDRYELKEKSHSELEKVIRFMTSNPDVKIEVGGHTDNVGASDYNLQLSERRAKAVESYLLANGVPAARIVSRGYGSSKPVGDNTTEAGRQLNRRIEFRILSPVKAGRR